MIFAPIAVFLFEDATPAWHALSADNWTKIVAVAVGAAWTVMNFVRGRTYRKRLDVDLPGSFAKQSGVILFTGECKAKNLGGSEIPLVAYGSLDEHKSKLTDAYLDGALDRADYEQRKTALHMERLNLEEKLQIVDSGTSLAMAELEHYVTLVKNAQALTNLLFTEELREWMQEAMSHRTASGKTIVFTLRKPLAEVSLRSSGSFGRTDKDTSHNFWREWLHQFAQRF